MGRLLGVPVTVPASLTAGGLGIAVAAVSAGTIGTNRKGIGSDIAFAFASFLIALVFASVVGLLARSRQLNFGHPPGTEAFRPLKPFGHALDGSGATCSWPGSPPGTTSAH